MSNIFFTNERQMPISYLDHIQSICLLGFVFGDPIVTQMLDVRTRIQERLDTHQIKIAVFLILVVDLHFPPQIQLTIDQGFQMINQHLDTLNPYVPLGYSKTDRADESIDQFPIVFFICLLMLNY
ncbi:unnamed protein product [Adineta ricciae]|uniref:Uncharacterized protein n=1 Tax=Adineta ricciae TaxID=249248 RepID=A0A815N5A3_ADIRI|nr:unnamed protein product [Adineta ricciae]